MWVKCKVNVGEGHLTQHFFDHLAQFPCRTQPDRAWPPSTTTGNTASSFRHDLYSFPAQVTFLFSIQSLCAAVLC